MDDDAQTVAAVDPQGAEVLDDDAQEGQPAMELDRTVDNQREQGKIDGTDEAHDGESNG